MEENRHLISEASKALGIEPHVLRYWEEELALTIHRNEMGHRYYTDADLRVLQRVHELKDQGFQLKALKIIVPQLYADKDVNLNKMLGQASAPQEKREEKQQGHAVSGTNQNVIGLDSVRSVSTTYVKLKPSDHQRKASGGGAADSISKEKSLSYGKASAAAIAKSSKEKQRDIGVGVMVQGKAEEKPAKQESAQKKAEEKPAKQESAQKKAEGKPAKQESIQGKTKESSREDIGMGKTAKSNTVVAARKPQDMLSNEHKLAQFQEIMNLAVSKALAEQQHAIGDAVGARMSEEVSERVSDKVLKQMDYLMRESEDHAEERYKKLDETIREVQKARMEAAAAGSAGKKKGLFHKKEKKNKKK